jgi:uncharacterized protein (PEP-CTERM system associated)
MTITTAKHLTTTTFRLTPLALAALLLSTAAHAGEWHVSPTVTLRETYSDNLNSQPDQFAAGGFVSEVAPAVSVSGKSRRLQFNGSAEARRYFYPGSDAKNVRNGDLRYGAGTKAELLDDYLFLDASTSSSRQMVSPFGPLSLSTYTSDNNTNIRTWSISPYFSHRFGTTATVTVRLARDAVTSGQRNAFGDTLSTTRSLNVASGSHFTDFGWRLTHTHQEMTSSIGGGEYVSENSLLSLRERINRSFALTSTLGYDNYEYPVFNQRTRGPGWSGGFIWTPSSRTKVDLSFGRRYFGKTGALQASHRTRRTVSTLSYSDGVSTTRSQFLLPASPDTAAMLDTLFLNTYPDAAQRQVAVQDYIAATGLPPSLATNINYLSNRFIRNKRLQGTVLLRGAHSDLTFNVFKDERRALSLAQFDTPLLNSQPGALYNNTKQTGISTSGDYRLSSHTRAHASLYLVRVQSLETDLTNNVQQFTVGMTHFLDSRTIAGLDLRHSAGRVDVLNNNNKYHENAVVATLSIRY